MTDEPQKGDFRMNIGAIGTLNYYSGYQNNRVIQKAGTKSFGNTTVNGTANTVILLNGTLSESSRIKLN